MKKSFLLCEHVYNLFLVKRTNNMDNKEYENRYQGTTRVLKIVGWILLIVGIICFITGIGSFFASMASFGSEGFEMPKFFFLCFLGGPAIIGGIVCLSLGYRRKMMDYAASQAAPVAKDFTNYMLDETGDSIANIANKISSKRNEPIEGVTGNKCARCGFINPANAKFCSKCGAPITKICSYCGAENDDGAKYCNSCGKPLY